MEKKKNETDVESTKPVEATAPKPAEAKPYSGAPNPRETGYGAKIVDDYDMDKE